MRAHEEMSSMPPDDAAAAMIARSAPQAPETLDEIVAAWVEGWTRSRGTAPPTPAYGGLRVEVGLPDQQARYVFAGPSAGVAQASREIDAPHVLLKVSAPPEAVQPLLAKGWKLDPVGFLMTTDDLTRPAPRGADGYRYEIEVLPHGYVVTAHAEWNGEAAASGRAFLAGAVAVFDQIVTEPAHRRRGLGRAVMHELALAAAQAGATHGALVATPDGQALYSTLGWRLVSPLTTAVRL
jgi:GNAT superfamily N-acetyltransferase